MCCLSRNICIKSTRVSAASAESIRLLTRNKWLEAVMLISTQGWGKRKEIETARWQRDVDGLKEKYQIKARSMEPCKNYSTRHSPATTLAKESCRATFNSTTNALLDVNEWETFVSTNVHHCLCRAVQISWSGIKNIRKWTFLWVRTYRSNSWCGVLLLQDRIRANRILLAPAL